MKMFNFLFDMSVSNSQMELKVNPATGLPIIDNDTLDVSGNVYGSGNIFNGCDMIENHDINFMDYFD